jgi:hypothetical protein
MLQGYLQPQPGKLKSKREREGKKYIEMLTRTGWSGILERATLWALIIAALSTG